jgi:hypothetical protein
MGFSHATVKVNNNGGAPTVNAFNYSRLSKLFLVEHYVTLFFSFLFKLFSKNIS